MRHFIISQPKAGTYLCANLLKELGLPFSNIHVSIGKYTIYKPEDVAKGLKKGEAIQSKFKESVKTCKDGHFTVGHIPHLRESVEALKGWKKIVLVRDQEEREESFKLWQEEANRKWSEPNHKRYTKAIPKDIEKWKDEPDIFLLDFKDMIEVNTERLDELQLYLFDEIKHESNQCMQRAIDADSLTKSSKRK